MPSRNMLPKGHRHRSVRAEYVATRGVEEAVAPVVPTVEMDVYDGREVEHRIAVPAEGAGLRLDQYLAQAIPEISRSRVQLLIESGQVRVNGAAAKAKHKIATGEVIAITGSPRPAPLRATAEKIALEVVFEDEFLAVVNKPAGMMVHAGAGAARLEDEAGSDARSSGTLVNALLHYFNHRLSGVGGELRPGIVHRLDKQTSGLLIVAKDDVTHRKLGEMFAGRAVNKTYVALVHGHVARTDTTVNLPIGRDVVRRTRMTTRRAAGGPGVRPAVSHVHVLERLRTPHGLFTLVEVRIETGRTHQIRVHLQSMGHPVVGDSLYGAPHQIRRVGDATGATLSLERNFLHAARLSLTHPRTGEPLAVESGLPEELTAFVAQLRADG